MPKKLKLGIVGGGGDSLIGVLHRVAAFINDNYQIVTAVFTSDFEKNIEFAREIDIPTDPIDTSINQISTEIIGEDDIVKETDVEKIQDISKIKASVSSPDFSEKIKKVPKNLLWRIIHFSEVLQ